MFYGSAFRIFPTVMRPATSAPNRVRGQAGFTLIELLVVVALLAVLSGTAVLGIGTMRQTANEQVCKTDYQTVENALEAFRIISGGTIPPTADLDTLITARLLKDKGTTRNRIAVAGDSVSGIGPCASIIQP